MDEVAPNLTIVATRSGLVINRLTIFMIFSVIAYTVYVFSHCDYPAISSFLDRDFRDNEFSCRFSLSLSLVPFNERPRQTLGVSN